MMEIMIDMHVDQKSIHHATTVINGCIETMAKDPKALIKIFSLLNGEKYLIKHAMATSIFALLLGFHEGFKSEKTLRILGLGSFLHDIGMVRLSFNPESKADLNAKEMKEIKEHPQIGRRLLESIPGITPEVRTIILEHHEQINGLGYPNGLHGNEIYPPSKIVSVADVFSALIMDRPFRKAYKPAKALQMMYEDRGKFDVKILDQLAKFIIKTS